MDASVSARVFLLCLLVLSGCEGDRATAPQVADLFAPTAMRVHPIFTQIADWTHSGKADGIEAQLEFTDQFGDPTKASGRVLFELFEYRRDSPDPRGKRLGRWVGSLETLDEQRERWNTTLRTYRFQLDYPAVSPSQSYVLSGIFELSGGGRFFNSIVLPAHVPEKAESKEHTPLGAE
jgi:hypothetical protein